MELYQEKSFKNKIEPIAANSSDLKKAVQLKDNRELSVRKINNNLQNEAGLSHNVIQLRVSANRIGGGFKSSLTGLNYPTRQEAEQAESDYLAEQERIRLEERPPVDFQFQPPLQGPPIGQTPLASALLNNPVHFGPVMTTGGDVTREQVNALAGSPVIPHDQATAFSARNTHAMVFSEGLDGLHVHSHSGVSTPVNNVTNETHPVPQFYQSHLFRQGPPPQHVNLPDNRSTAHAEALAVHSEAYRSAVKRNADDIEQFSDIMDFDPEVGVGDATPEQFENLLNFVSGLPVNSNIAINRASCGHKGGSGHVGGCNQEMAETGEDYPEMLQQYMNSSQLAFLATQTGMASFGVSASGPYKEQGNPARMAESDVKVSMHNSFDWKKGQGRPISRKQQEYEARSREVDPSKKKKVKLKRILASSHKSDIHKRQDPPPPPPPSSSPGIFV